LGKSTVNTDYFFNMANAIETKEEITNEIQMEHWTQLEKDESKKKYGCEILVSNGSWEEVSIKDAPNDARIVTYLVDGDKCFDLMRSIKEGRIFDMYWDKFSKNLLKIQFGFGRANPKTWGYVAPQSNKKK